MGYTVVLKNGVRLFSHYFFDSSRNSSFSTVYDRTTVRASDISYVPYEIFQNFKIKHDVLYVHVHARFLCPIYSTPFDVSYVPYEIIQSNSQKRPISRNSITFDPDRILGFRIDHWTGNFHAHWISSRAAVQHSYVQWYFRSRRNTCAAVF